MADTQDLTALPAPDLIEALSFEALFIAHRDDLIARHPEAADVIALESEPLVKLLQAFAYRELLFRQRVNTAGRSNLLAFAAGADLDHKGAFYGLPRLAGETDARFRLRIQLRIASLSGSGTAEHYKLVALTADANVRDAAVQQPMPGRVAVVLWTHDAASAAATLLVVEAALNAEANRPVGVPVSVSLAVARPMAVRARIWRTAAAPVDLVARIAAALAAALDARAGLGVDVARSWLTTRLHVDGVARVQYPDDTAPPVNLVLAANEFPVLADVVLTDEGIA